MLQNLVLKTWEKLGPDITVDEENKQVIIEPKYFFSNITELVYSLRGYKVINSEDPPLRYP